MFLNTFREKNIKEKLDNLAQSGEIDEATYKQILDFYALGSDEQISALIKMNNTLHKVVWDIKRIDTYKLDHNGKMRYEGEFIDVKRAAPTSADIKSAEFHENKVGANSPKTAQNSKIWRKVAIWGMIWALVFAGIVALLIFDYKF